MKFVGSKIIREQSVNLAMNKKADATSPCAEITCKLGSLKLELSMQFKNSSSPKEF